MVLLTSSRTADPAAMTAFYGWQRGCCPSVGNSISALRRSLAFVSRSDRTCSFRPPLVANSRLSMLNVSAFGRFARCARLSRSGENEEIYRKTCCKDQWGGGIGSAISPPAGDEGALVVVTDAKAVTAVEVAATVEAGGCDCFQLEAYTRNQANSLICSGYLWRSHQ